MGKFCTNKCIYQEYLIWFYLSALNQNCTPVDGLNSPFRFHKRSELFAEPSKKSKITIKIMVPCMKINLYLLCIPGVSFRTFCSGRKPNENDGWWSRLHFSGEYVPGANEWISRNNTNQWHMTTNIQNICKVLTRHIGFNLFFGPRPEAIGWLMCHIHFFRFIGSGC